MATSTLGSGTLVLAGTTSGTTTVTATAVAGTTTLTLPAATDTLVGKATTDTLTNKTLTGAAMNGTLGATTPSTGAFTTLTSTGASSFATSSGSVGIGTSSPGAKLDVATTTGFTYAATSTAGVNIGTQGTAGGSLMVQTASGSSGFGSGLAIDGAYSGGTLISTVNIKAFGVYGSGYASNLAFYTSSGTTLSEKMRLDASGNLLVGDTSQSGTANRVAVFSANKFGLSIIDTTAQATGVGGALNLGGNYRSAGDAQAFARVAAVKENSTDADYAYGIAFSVTPNGGTFTERQKISSAGIVTMSAYGVGTATFSAAGVISSVSDEKWKIKDGVPVDPDAMLKKLEPGYWFYNDEKKESFGADRQLGFYAQNVNSAIGPEAAPTPEEGKPWGYYDRSVLAVTVMSLQKALATIETLTARITALESA
jgi:hypothetical protein